MRYERRGGDPAAVRPWNPRTKRVVLGLGAILLAGGGIGIGFALATGPKKVDVIPGLARPFLQANVLLENLGSPTPKGKSGFDWALVGDPLVGPASAPRLADAERAWVGVGGVLLPLSSSDAASILTGQLRLDSSILTGGLLSRYDSELRSIVASERGSSPTPSSPGGARIVMWYSLDVHGQSATADAVVETWEQRDSFDGSGANRRVEGTIELAEVESEATLEHVRGRWLVASLNQAPWAATT